MLSFSIMCEESEGVVQRHQYIKQMLDKVCGGCSPEALISPLQA